MTITMDEVLTLFADRDARQREIDERRAAEADRRATEADRRATEADRRAAEADRRFAEVEQFIAKNFAEVDRRAEERRAEIERMEALRRAETELHMRQSKEEWERQMKVLNQQMGKLSGRLGQFVEAMIMPAVVSLFRSRGIDVHEVHPNVTAKRPQGSIEIDLLVVNDGDVIAVECKSRLNIEDVNNHLVRMSKIKTLLPTYRDKRLLGAVATMVLDDQVGRYAYTKGLYVLAQSGETVEIKNDMDFQPAYR